MSNLRRIMQKLADSQSSQPTKANNIHSGSMVPSRLYIHEFQKKLDMCTDAMLQYEWAWLGEHYEDLELCLSYSEMADILGGTSHVERLLLETKEYQIEVEKVMKARKVNPSLHHHPIASSDHAWGLSEESIKKAWGIV